MELKLNVGDKIQIPDNCNAVIKDGVVVIEKNKPKFKKGDFVSYPGSWIYIFNNKKDNEYSWIAKVNNNGTLYINYNSNYYDPEYENSFRYATDYEKQLLLDKLHESGKDWDAEKCKIVDLKYVPKVGDCLKLEYDGEAIFIECSGLENGKYPCGYKTIINQDGLFENNFTHSGWTDHWKVTKITREELQAEFNKLGYEYDFNTHTAKKIEWEPKIGEKVWYISGDGKISHTIWSEDHEQSAADFRTRELAESALELLKNAKHY